MRVRSRARRRRTGSLGEGRMKFIGTNRARRQFTLFEFLTIIDFEMDDISEQLAIRDSYRRKLAKLKTPAERMPDFFEMQQRMWTILESSPEGYARFLRRNYKNRACDFKEP